MSFPVDSALPEGSVVGRGTLPLVLGILAPDIQVGQFELGLSGGVPLFSCSCFRSFLETSCPQFVLIVKNPEFAGSLFVLLQASFVEWEYLNL